MQDIKYLFYSSFSVHEKVETEKPRSTNNGDRAGEDGYAEVV